MSRIGRALAVIALAPLVGLGAAEATTVNFVANPIDGAHEVPPNASTAMASGTFVMDTDANTLSVNVIVSAFPPSGEIAAHIHGPAEPGVNAAILEPLDLGTPKVEVWNFPENRQQEIIDELMYVNIHSNDLPGGEIRGQIVRVPSCPDGIIDEPAEQCDDGNTNAGDCCSATCQLEAGCVTEVPLIVKVLLYKPGNKIKIVSKGSFPLPDSSDDPTVEGGRLTFKTEANPTGTTFALPDDTWSTIGPPTAPKGFKAKTGECKRVLVKNNVLKALCTAPDLGALPIDPVTNEISALLQLGVPGGTRYCGVCGGEVKGNPDKAAKRKDCAAPAGCLPTSPSGAFLDRTP